ncbi:hypothetical protein Pelo_1265 [Pelomyxa schiedti]|nr:hypothetical protein Pelo_1265 [Pelomyxa schiedti]
MTSISAEIQKIQQALARRQKILEEEVETKCGIISQPLLQLKDSLNLPETTTMKAIKAVEKILELDDELILLGASKLALGELSLAKTVTPHLPVINPNQDFVLPTFQGTQEILSALPQLTLKSRTEQKSTTIGDTTTLLPILSVAHPSSLLPASNPKPEPEPERREPGPPQELTLKSPTEQKATTKPEQEEPEHPELPEAEEGKERSDKCLPFNGDCSSWDTQTAEVHLLDKLRNLCIEVQNDMSLRGVESNKLAPDMS